MASRSLFGFRFLPLMVLLLWPALEAAPIPLETRPCVDPATHKSYTETIPRSKVHFEMVAVPGGVYWRGSPNDEKQRKEDEGPAHAVRIRPFWMGQCEVTWDEFDLYSKDGPVGEHENEKALAKDADAITRPTPPYIDETHGYGREGYPVIGISHHAAMEYCRWLSKKTGKAYRLPTEAEWEWACRAGTRTAYSFGDDPKDLKDHAWFVENSGESTHPVGKKKPNPWGLYDMHGNVGEWCLDHYEADLYGSFPTGRLTLAPVKLPTEKRFPHVVRGGSWDDSAARCRSAARRASDKSWNRSDPARPQSLWWLADNDFVGFRIVRAVEEQENLTGIRSKVNKESK
jgi:formylglycine-generating enzyme required for sulfatase activity